MGRSWHEMGRSWQVLGRSCWGRRKCSWVGLSISRWWASLGLRSAWYALDHTSKTSTITFHWGRPYCSSGAFRGVFRAFQDAPWTRWACFQITSWNPTPVLLTFVTRQCLLTWSKLWLRIETDSLRRDLTSKSWHPSALSSCLCFVKGCLPIILLKPHMTLLLSRLIMTSSTLIGPWTGRLGQNLLLKVRLAPEDRIKLLEIQSEQEPGSSTYPCLCPSNQASCWQREEQ